MSSRDPLPHDLSMIHEPIGDLFSHAPDSGDLFIDDAQIRFFHEHGYVAGIPVLDQDQITALRDELSEFFSPQHEGRELWYEYHVNESPQPDTVLFHALGAWRLRAGFHDLLWHPGITRMASQLLDGAVRFWHDQLFCKPANHGGVVAWHQDYSYWTRTTPMAHLTCWIGLDDSSADNGGIHYVPGSHQWDLLPRTELAGDLDGIRHALTPQQWEAFQHPVSVPMKAGECAFHHPLTLHGSFENSTDQPRRAVVLNFIRDGVCSASNDPLLAGTDAVPAGQPLAGQYFPLLFDPTTP